MGQKIGTAQVSESKGGVSFKLAITSLPPGQRGFHIHEKGDCGPAMKDGKMTAGVAAGEHYDPDGKKSHKGPKGSGHKGDLPVLNGTAKGIKQTVTATRLKLSDVQGRAIVIHKAVTTTPTNPKMAAAKAASRAESSASSQASCAKWGHPKTITYQSCAHW